MDHYLTIWSIVVYIENRLEGPPDYRALSEVCGFSLAHLRDLFARQTGVSLHRYVTGRKMAHAAFALAHTEESVLSIAGRLGYQHHDTFTRAFRRVTGHTPQAFRREKRPVGRKRLGGGIFGVCLQEPGKETHVEGNLHQTTGSTVLYGVPRAHYGAYHGCTPFPICLKSSLNYLGQEAAYADLIVTCGAAFRLTWDESGWNGGNVDVLHTFEDPWKVFRLGIEGAGRSFSMIARSSSPGEGGRTDLSQAGKQAFVDFLVPRLAQGMPVIGLGVIGPPEACVVTGYREDGNVWLGWNLFQEDPERQSMLSFDESGYFVTRQWWENTQTVALLGIGPQDRPTASPRQVLQAAAEAMTGRKTGTVVKGVWAYDAWKRALLDDSAFPPGAVLPLLSERLMCQGDATDCLSDGRYHAMMVLRQWAQEMPDEAGALRDIADCFERVSQAVFAMIELLGGWERGEGQMRALALPEVRREIAKQIDIAREEDTRALEKIQAFLRTS